MDVDQRFFLLPYANFPDSLHPGIEWLIHISVDELDGHIWSTCWNHDQLMPQVGSYGIL